MRTTSHYPQRPGYFAMHFIRLLGDVEAANQIGEDGCWFLSTIVTHEDKYNYRPVDFRPGQLLRLLGLGSDDALERLRRKLVLAGWLHYIPGRKRSPGQYWVTIPPEHRGRIRETLSPAEVRDHTSIPRTNAGETAGQTAGWTADPPLLSLFPNHPLSPNGGQGDALGEEAKKIPKPKRVRTDPPESVPIPPEIDTPEFRSAWSDWLADRRARRNPVTVLAAKQQLDMLATYGPAGAVESIRQSIRNGWTGLFPADRQAGRETLSTPKRAIECMDSRPRPRTPSHPLGDPST